MSDDKEAQIQVILDQIKLADREPYYYLSTPHITMLQVFGCTPQRINDYVAELRKAASAKGVLGGGKPPPAGACLAPLEPNKLACSVSGDSPQETFEDKGHGGIQDIDSGLVSRTQEVPPSPDSVVDSAGGERTKTEPPQSAAKGEALAKEERATRQIRIRLPVWFCDQLETLKPTRRQDVMESFCECWKGKIDITKFQDSSAQIRKIGINLNSVIKVIHERRHPENTADLLRVIIELRDFCQSIGGRNAS